MIDAVFLTKFVEQVVAADAKFCLERILRIIHTGVDNFTIPAARFLAESAVFFENEDIFVCARYFGGNCQPYYPRADDDDIDIVRHK
jgi:hypothetical protein